MFIDKFYRELLGTFVGNISSFILYLVLSQNAFPLILSKRLSSSLLSMITQLSSLGILMFNPARVVFLVWKLDLQYVTALQSYGSEFKF